MTFTRFFSGLILSACCMLLFVSCEPEVIPEYVTSFDKKILLENFTSEGCVNCPTGEKQIEAYLLTHPNVIVVSHHAGYKDDQWTIADSKVAVRMLGIEQLGTPTVCMDRTKSTYTDPESGTSYSDLAIHPYYLAHLCEANYGTYASLQITNQMEGNQLRVQVHVRKLDKGNNDLRLTVLLKENGLHGKQTDPNYTLAGSWDEYVHANVVRAYLSPVLGDSIVLQESNAHETACDASYTLDWQEGWTPDHCMVVAYLTDAKGMNVVQAEEAPVVAGTDGGASLPHGGITPKAVPEGYPEGKYSLKDFVKADTVHLEYANAFYNEVNANVREWHIMAWTTQQAYGTGNNMYIPVTDIVFFTDAQTSQMPTSGEWPFTIARTIDEIRVGTAWAGYCDVEAQQIYGSEVIMAHYSSFMLGQMVPGTNGRWLISNGSKITFAQDGFTVNGTSAKGYPIVLSFRGRVGS